MKNFLVLLLTLNIGLVCAETVLLKRGSSTQYNKHQILCSSTAHNSCFSVAMENGKVGIMLNDGTTRIAKDNGVALVELIKELSHSDKCQDVFMYPKTKYTIMPPGSSLQFKEKTFYCPSVYQAMAKRECEISSIHQNHIIKTPTGLTIRSGSFQNTKMMIRRLNRANVCETSNEQA